MLFRRVSSSAKNAVNNSRGLLFDTYQERLGPNAYMGSGLRPARKYSKLHV